MDSMASTGSLNPQPSSRSPEAFQAAPLCSQSSAQLSLRRTAKTGKVRAVRPPITRVAIARFSVQRRNLGTGTRACPVAVMAGARSRAGCFRNLREGAPAAGRGVPGSAPGSMAVLKASLSQRARFCRRAAMVRRRSADGAAKSSFAGCVTGGQVKVRLSGGRCQ